MNRSSTSKSYMQWYQKIPYRTNNLRINTASKRPTALQNKFSSHNIPIICHKRKNRISFMYTFSQLCLLWLKRPSNMRLWTVGEMLAILLATDWLYNCFDEDGQVYVSSINRTESHLVKTVQTSLGLLQQLHPVAAKQWKRTFKQPLACWQGFPCQQQANVN